jgi:enoyl-CoA hydratase/carnithine racemase
MPFEVATHDGILSLTLDTPGSPINIFNHATAQQLVDILSTVTPATTRAIVFDTAKRNSFINGVGLLLAHAAQTDADLIRASALPWKAYRAVRDAPVPTIAVVQGNCFGCGVEFALSCDYRIASDTWETQFYMTELNDYLFIPLFGGTWNLPEAVGLAGAVDLLLWGERWDAETARAGGLIDQVVSHEDLGEQRRRFVQRVVQGERPSRRRGRITWGAGEEAVMERTRCRIGSLPPRYQDVYRTALGLLEAGARQVHGYVDHQRQELRCSIASALSANAKSAYGFFYVRQMASERAAGRARSAAPPVTFSVDAGGDADTRAFADALRRRKLPGVRVGDGEGGAFRLVAPPGAGSRASARDGHAGAANGHGGDLAVRTALAAAPEADVEVYAPTYRCGGRLIELATRRGGGSPVSPEAVMQVAHALQRFGFEVARTNPGAGFVSTRLLLAFLAPLLRFALRGGEVAVINATLRRAGFVRLPAALLTGFDGDRIARCLAPAFAHAPADIESPLAALRAQGGADGAPDEALLDAICISLLEAVLGARADGDVRDPSVTDLIARELLDFPRHLCSLGTWLKRARVARAVRNPNLRTLVSAAALAAADGFVAGGREFYR